MDDFNKLFFDPVVRKFIIVAMVLAVLIAIIRLLKHAASRHAADADTRYRIKKFLNFSGYLATIFLLSVIYRNQLGGLTITFGIAGAGIAFALQEVIISFAGWIAIPLGHFYKTGDRVQLGGIKGDVIDIGFLRTTLMEVGQWVDSDLYTGRIVRIANSFVFREPVFNYSGDFPFLWDEITVPVRHGSDQNLAREIFQRIAEEATMEYIDGAKKEWHEMVKMYVIEDARIEPMVSLIVTDNWMSFTIRYIVNYKKRRATKDLLFTKILEAFDKTGGKVRIASTTMEVVGLPPIQVKTI